MDWCQYLAEVVVMPLLTSAIIIIIIICILHTIEG